jgi:hypothetical protein
MKQSLPLRAIEGGRLLRYARNDILCCACSAESNIVQLIIGGKQVPPGFLR